VGPIGFQEVVVILLLALIFLGPKKLPDIASGIGKAIREVRKATADIKRSASSRS
jgi:Tat protein translocase TatB subunit